jgi:hypothetical protein
MVCEHGAGAPVTWVLEKLATRMQSNELRKPVLRA